MKNFLQEYQNKKGQLDDRFLKDQSYSESEYIKDSHCLDTYYSRYIFLPKRNA